MATLPQISLDFNRKIKLSNDGGALSSDTGSFLFREFDETIGFSKTINQHLHLKDDRLYHIHSNANLLRQKLYQIIAGYAEDDSADHLTTDPVFTQILGSDALASQPSLSRFWSRFDDTSIEQLDRANQTLLDKVHAHRQSEALIIDLDSTHADTYGAQEDAAYNTHYNTVGFHPIIAFDGMTGDFLKVKLRSGNVYTSNGVVDFVQPLIAHYNEKFPATTPFLRGDSGFAVPALYELCETESVAYIIRLKSNAILQRIADEMSPATASDITETEYHFEATEYQAKSWSKPRTVIVQSVRPANELFFTHSFFITNLGDAFSPENIVKVYNKRGTMENYIKEAKNGFRMDKMDSHTFRINAAKMMLSLLAYNLTNWLRTLCFPDGQQTMQIETIRIRIIKVASKLVKSARSLQFKLSSSFVYKDFFDQVLRRIQRLKLE
ncbi:IS1380 family transposase [Salinicoccus sp. Marseille-QA3877]